MICLCLLFLLVVFNNVHDFSDTLLMSSKQGASHSWVKAKQNNKKKFHRFLKIHFLKQVVPGDIRRDDLLVKIKVIVHPANGLQYAGIIWAKFESGQLVRPNQIHDDTHDFFKKIFRPKNLHTSAQFATFVHSRSKSFDASRISNLVFLFVIVQNSKISTVKGEKKTHNMRVRLQNKLEIVFVHFLRKYNVSGKNNTTGKQFTQLLVVSVATNLISTW